MRRSAQDYTIIIEIGGRTAAVVAVCVRRSCLTPLRWLPPEDATVIVLGGTAAVVVVIATLTTLRRSSADGVIFGGATAVVVVIAETAIGRLPFVDVTPAMAALTG